MDYVENAEMRVIELVEQAQAVMHKQNEEWMTEDDKLLQSEAMVIKDNVSDAIRKAERLAEAIIPERVYPAPYQALLDELAPLLERKGIADRFCKAMGAISKNPYYGHGKTHPWNRVLSHALANDVFAIWQTDGRDINYARLGQIRYQMDNKSRQGSKVEQARDEWNRVYTQQVATAVREAEAEIHAANPSWATILKEYSKLGQTLEARKATELALFKEPIRKALDNLHFELEFSQEYTGKKAN
jgi:hypothetical protein